MKSRFIKIHTAAEQQQYIINEKFKCFPHVLVLTVVGLVRSCADAALFCGF